SRRRARRKYDPPVVATKSGATVFASLARGTTSVLNWPGGERLSRDTESATGCRHARYGRRIHYTSSQTLTIVDCYSIINVMIEYSSRQLRAFILVAQHRSFAAAAGRMFITPSGLSVMIRELESQVGARLFDRTTRHVALTSAGSELLSAVEPALRDVDGAMSRIGGASAAAVPSLAVGVTPFMVESVLAPALRAFRSRRPGFEIHVADSVALTIAQQVEAGKLDVGLGVFFSHLRGVRRTPLFRFSFFVIRPADGHAPRRATSWASLKRETLISQ